MKTQLLLVALFLAFYVSAWHFGRLRSVQKHSESPTPLNGPTFALMSWNIGLFDYESDSQAQDKDLEAIAAVIGETDAQVIPLQEIAPPEPLRSLSDLLVGRYRYHTFSRGFRTDRYVGFLSQIPSEEETQVATSMGRDALAVTLDVPSQGCVTLVNSHADAFDARRRRFYVNDVIDSHRSNGKQTLIPAGDFNFGLAPVESSDLFTNDKKNDSRILQDFLYLGRNSGPTSDFDRRIDHVFQSPQGLEAVDFKVLYGWQTRAGNRPSPLVGKV
ncbi:MAG: endonuclease/exonuclease/phosphatase family protein [Acidobacteria bacterium]|nr:endonuclease/exonuclease/phosphatase family protein [Acidobacteriota bacterium]